MSNQNIKPEHLYSDLTHEIIGSAMEIQNHLGCGHREKYYNNALDEEFKRRKLKYKREVPANLIFKGKSVGKRFFDFLVDQKVVVEIKVSHYLSKANFDQLTEYLHLSGLQLGLLILFSSTGIKVRRVYNIPK